MIDRIKKRLINPYRWVIKGTITKNPDYIRYVGDDRGGNREDYVEHISNAKIFMTKEEATDNMKANKFVALKEKAVKVKIEIKEVEK